MMKNTVKAASALLSLEELQQLLPAGTDVKAFLDARGIPHGGGLVAWTEMKGALGLSRLITKPAPSAAARALAQVGLTVENTRNKPKAQLLVTPQGAARVLRLPYRLDRRLDQPIWLRWLRRATRDRSGSSVFSITTSSRHRRSEVDIILCSLLSENKHWLVSEDFLWWAAEHQEEARPHISILSMSNKQSRLVFHFPRGTEGALLEEVVR